MGRFPSGRTPASRIRLSGNVAGPDGRQPPARSPEGSEAGECGLDPAWGGQGGRCGRSCTRAGGGACGGGGRPRRRIHPGARRRRRAVAGGRAIRSAAGGGTGSFGADRCAVAVGTEPRFFPGDHAGFYGVHQPDRSAGWHARGFPEAASATVGDRCRTQDGNLSGDRCSSGQGRTGSGWRDSMAARRHAGRNTAVSLGIVRGIHHGWGCCRPGDGGRFRLAMGRHGGTGRSEGRSACVGIRAVG